MAKVDVKWLDDQVAAFSEARPRFETYAKVLQIILHHAVTDVCDSAIVQSRAKKLPSFAGKCVRQYETLKNCAAPLDALTDLCGGRVIVQLQSQVDALCRFVRDHFKIDEKNSQDTRERLRADQFGYRSVHYIVWIRRSAIEGLGLASERGPLTPSQLQEVEGLKAEIQIRTIAQHAWADTGHSSIYKAAFELPAAFQRRNAKIAAMLEEVDSSFTELVDGIDDLYSNVSVYRASNETQDEIDQLQAILRHDPLNVSLTAELARRQISIDRCTDAIETVDRYQTRYEHAQSDPLKRWPSELLACKGRALCMDTIDRPHDQAYKAGRDLLREAHTLDPTNLEAATHLAESSVVVDRDEALAQFEAAFEIDADNPVALGGYLRHRLAEDRQGRVLALLRPNIEAAARRCRQQIATRVNLPHALFHLAEFELLLQPFERGTQLDHAYQGLYALCRAISLCGDSPKLLKVIIARFELLSRIDHAPWLGWAKQTLLLAQSVSAGSLQARLTKSRDYKPIRGPVLIVAGGCDAESEKSMPAYRQPLEDILYDFAGTVICGGTREGISGLAGALCFERRARIHAIGYLPQTLPADNSAHRDDDHYTDIRLSMGTRGFSPAEPIQSWVDLLASGIKPTDVTLIGINGGDIAGFEYHLAAALGAKVAIVTNSGRRADTLMLERDQPGNEKIYFFPLDTETFRAIISFPPTSSFKEEEILDLSAAIDRVYHDAAHRVTVEAWRKELARDQKLSASFSISNRMQAEHIPEKLRRIGKKAVRVTGREPRVEPFNTKDVELLAEMEHGRWIVDRTWEGWRFGPKRDDTKRERPQLICWNDLPQSEREKDLETVRRIPEYLASIGYEVVSVD